MAPPEEDRTALLGVVHDKSKDAYSIEVYIGRARIPVSGESPTFATHVTVASLPGSL